MKKFEVILNEQNVRSFFEMLGKTGVEEAVINVFSSGERKGADMFGKEVRRKVRVEFYCPNSILEELKSNIVSYAKVKKDDMFVEIMNVEEKIRVLKNNMYNVLKERRVSCL